MPPPHYYAGLDKEPALSLNISVRDMAVRIVESNHGVHRLLSHLIDARRERLQRRISEYRQRGDDDVAESVERRGDLLADALEKLLRDDCV
jgi:uncharacterized radical SAM superfamily protein